MIKNVVIFFNQIFNVQNKIFWHTVMQLLYQTLHLPFDIFHNISMFTNN